MTGGVSNVGNTDNGVDLVDGAAEGAVGSGVDKHKDIYADAYGGSFEEATEVDDAPRGGFTEEPRGNATLRRHLSGLGVLSMKKTQPMLASRML